MICTALFDVLEMKRTGERANAHPALTARNLGKRSDMTASSHSLAYARCAATPAGGV
jgi:hypothetical protein